MDMFEKFIMSDAFFPVLIVLLLLVVGVFVWILLSGRKKVSAEVVTPIVTEEKPVEPVSVPQPSEVVEEPKVEDAPKNEERPDELIRELCPINTMDETPVDIFVPTGDDDKDEGEAVVIEHSEPLVEENVSPDEYVDIELPQKRIIDEGETVEIPEASGDFEDVGEEVKIDDSPVSSPEVGKTSLAFDSVPYSNHAINTAVDTSLPKEYVGEKTEIFDFPDFNKMEGSNDTIKEN